MTQEVCSDSVSYLRRVLVRWYRANRRDLPWRADHDPYRVWISEIMLQQTRVAAVVSHYHRFLDRFPDIHTLARASVDDVLAVWTGLGYYRRARHLKAAADTIDRFHDGCLPIEEAALLALPGIGRYTCGAIRSIAFGKRAPILDGNVFRVLSRFFALPGSWTSTTDKTSFWRISERIVPEKNAGDFNQAMMEIGALVCTPRGWVCERCPLRKRCAAFARGEVACFPNARRRSAMTHLERDVYLITDTTGRVLLVRRPEEGEMGGMWELPDEWPCAKAGHRSLGSFRHSIMNRRYTVNVYSVSEPDCDRADFVEGCWVAKEEIGSYALTGITGKALAMQPKCCSARRQKFEAAQEAPCDRSRGLSPCKRSR